MKETRKKYFVLLFIFFFFFALLRFPISLAAIWFLPEAVELEGAEGSLWRGRASALGWKGSVVQRNLAWTFRPDALFNGALLWQIRGKMNECTTQASLAITPAGPNLSNAQICLPAEPFFNHDAMMRSLRLGGDMKISVTHLSFRHPSDVLIDIQNLFSSLMADAGILGNMQIKLSIKENKAHWSMIPGSGLLSVSGQGEGTLNNGINGKLRLAIEPELIERINPFLSALQREADGQYILTLKN